MTENDWIDLKNQELFQIFYKSRRIQIESSIAGWWVAKRAFVINHWDRVCILLKICFQSKIVSKWLTDWFTDIYRLLEFWDLFWIQIFCIDDYTLFMFSTYLVEFIRIKYSRVKTIWWDPLARSKSGSW